MQDGEHPLTGHKIYVVRRWRVFVKLLRKTGSAGLLFFLAGSVLLMGIITAEIFYPAGYSTSNSELSDLGATRPPNSIIHQPSAFIFNLTMIAGGLLVLAASFFLFRATRNRLVTIFPGLLGAGILGVGIFPGNIAIFHPLFAIVAFIFGGLSAIVTSTVTGGTLRYLFMALGIITLTFLIFSSLFIPVLGDGGTERYIAYPVILWATGFGGYLVGSSENE